MNKPILLQEIVGVYIRHGWTLRRFLLTTETRAAISAQLEKHATNNVTIEDAYFDAIWFARAGGVNRDSWELRLLQTVPFALFEMLDADLPAPERDARLRAVEDRARRQINKTAV